MHYNEEIHQKATHWGSLAPTTSTSILSICSMGSIEKVIMDLAFGGHDNVVVKLSFV